MRSCAGLLSQMRSFNWLTLGALGAALLVGGCPSGGTNINPPGNEDPGEEDPNDPNNPNNPAPVTPSVTTNFDAARFYRGTATVSAQVTPASAAAGATVTVSIAGTVVCTVTAAPFDCSVDTTSLPDGDNTATVTATAAGLSASITVVVKVDNTPPTVPAPMAPPNGLAVLGLGDDIESTALTDATSGIALFEVVVADAVVASGNTPGEAANSFVAIVDTLPPDGVFTGAEVLFRATDAAGNVASTPVGFDVYVDTTPPTASFQALANVSLNPTFTLDAADATTGIQAVEFFLGASTTPLDDTAGCPRRVTAAQDAAALTGPFTCTLVPADLTNGQMTTLSARISDRSGALDEPNRVRTTNVSVSFTPDGDPTLALAAGFDADLPRSNDTLVIALNADTRGLMGTLAVTTMDYAGAVCVLAGTSSTCTINSVNSPAFAAIVADTTLALTVRLTTAAGHIDLPVSLNIDVTAPSLDNGSYTQEGNTIAPYPRFFLQFDEALRAAGPGLSVTVCASDEVGVCGGGPTPPALQVRQYSSAVEGSLDSFAVYSTEPFPRPAQGNQYYTIAVSGVEDVAGNAIDELRFTVNTAPTFGAEPPPRRQASVSVVDGEADVTEAVALEIDESRSDSSDLGTFVVNRTPHSVQRIHVRVPIVSGFGGGFTETNFQGQDCRITHVGGADSLRAKCAFLDSMVVPNAWDQNGTASDPSDDFMTVVIEDENNDWPYTELSPLNPIFETGLYRIDFEVPVPRPEFGPVYVEYSYRSLTLAVTETNMSAPPPQLGLVSPAGGSNIHSGTPLVLGFQTDLDPATYAGIELRDPANQLVPLVVTRPEELPVLLVSSKRVLTPGAYRLIITTNVRTVDGGALLAPVEVNYTVLADERPFNNETVRVSPRPRSVAATGLLNTNDLFFSYELTHPVLLNSVAAEEDFRVFEVVGVENVQIPLLGMRTQFGTHAVQEVGRTLAFSERGNQLQRPRPGGRVRTELNNVRRPDGSDWGFGAPLVANYTVAPDSVIDLVSGQLVAAVDTLPFFKRADINLRPRADAPPNPQYEVDLRLEIGPRELCISTPAAGETSVIITHVGAGGDVELENALLNNSNCTLNYDTTVFDPGQRNHYRVTITDQDGQTISTDLYVFVPAAAPAFARFADRAASNDVLRGLSDLSVSFGPGDNRTIVAVQIFDLTFAKLRATAFLSDLEPDGQWLGRLQTPLSPGLAGSHTLITFPTIVMFSGDTSHADVLQLQDYQIFQSLRGKLLDQDLDDLELARFYGFDEVRGSSYESTALLAFPPGGVLGQFPSISTMAPVNSDRAPSRLSGSSCVFGGCLSFDNSTPGEEDVLAEVIEDAPPSFTVDLWLNQELPTPGTPGATGPLDCNDLTAVLANVNTPECRDDLPGNDPAGGCPRPGTVFSTAVSDPSYTLSGLSLLPLVDCGDGSNDHLLLSVHGASVTPGETESLALIYVGEIDPASATQDLFTAGGWTHVSLSFDVSGSSAVVHAVVNGQTFSNLTSLDLNNNADEGEDEMDAAVGYLRATGNQQHRIVLGGTVEDSDPAPGFQDGGRDFFGGLIDDFAVYGRALNPAELLQNHSLQSD